MAFAAGKASDFDNAPRATRGNPNIRATRDHLAFQKRAFLRQLSNYAPIEGPGKIGTKIYAKDFEDFSFRALPFRLKHCLFAGLHKF